jgi:hypothetical protein
MQITMIAGKYVMHLALTFYQAIAVTEKLEHESR